MRTFELWLCFCFMIITNITVMKKIYTAIFSLLIISMVNPLKAQENLEKNEFKLNAFNLIFFKSFDASYEYILNPNSSIGLSVLANLQNEPDWLEDISEMPHYNEKFALTPYYRHYFMNRYAKGFFLEAFGMFNRQKLYTSKPFFSGDEDYEYEYLGSSNNFALGIALGGKIVSRKNFVFEFFGGIGRNIVESNTDISKEFVPRVGINLGYRF